MRTFGYARVSTSKQSLKIQTDKLLEYGVIPSRIFSDIVSGKKFERTGLDDIKVKVEPGDEILVTKLDRLGRDTLDMVELVNFFTDLGVTIRFLDEGLTTGGSMGELVVTILSAVADAERKRILERTEEGRIDAIQKGVKFGRKKSIDRNQLKHLLDKNVGATEISRVMGIGRSTVYKLKSELENESKL